MPSDAGLQTKLSSVQFEYDVIRYRMAWATKISCYKISLSSF